MDGVDDALASLQQQPFQLDPVQEQFRAQLGLPTDVPIVMSGHQPGFWHMGIVAKVLAMHDLAHQHNAQPVWVVVDQDTLTSSQLISLRLPVVTNGTIDVLSWDLDTPGAARTMLDANRPLCLVPSLQSVSTAPDAGTINTERIKASLERHKGESSIAMQFTLAAMDVIYEWIDAITGTSTQRPIVIPATALARTDLFSSIVQRMTADPDRCIHAYNNATRIAPKAKMRPLDIASQELPIWSIDAKQGRVPVHAADLSPGTSRTPMQLAPRALLMTQMLRIAGCEAFIHGLGGGEYEHIGDAWFSQWKQYFNDPNPWIVTSATVTPISASFVQTNGLHVSPASISNALTLPHRAANNPALLGNDTLQMQKQELVKKINAAKHQGSQAERAAMFRELREIVQSAAASAEAQQQLAHTADNAAQARAKQRSVELAHNRTFPFFVYSRDTLRELHSLIHTRITT